MHPTNFVVDGWCPEHEHHSNIVVNTPVWQMHMCMKFEFTINISWVMDTKEKNKNMYEEYLLCICLVCKCRLSVKFEVSNTNISGVIHINITREQIWVPNEEY